MVVDVCALDSARGRVQPENNACRAHGYAPFPALQWPSRRSHYSSRPGKMPFRQCCYYFRSFHLLSRQPERPFKGHRGISLQCFNCFPGKPGRFSNDFQVYPFLFEPSGKFDSFFLPAFLSAFLSTFLSAFLSAQLPALMLGRFDDTVVIPVEF